MVPLSLKMSMVSKPCFLFIALLTGWIAWPKFKEQLNYVKNRGTAYTTFIHAMVAIIAPIVVLLVIYQGCFA